MMKLWSLVLMGLSYLSLGATDWERKIAYMRVTAYCPCKVCCGKHSNGITATGTSAWTPGMAVDRRTIPLGSRIDLPLYDRKPVWAPADDTGGPQVELDLRMKTHEEAVEFGVRENVRVVYWTRRNSR